MRRLLFASVSVLALLQAAFAKEASAEVWTFGVVDEVVQWAAPKTGEYDIVAAGAQGGSNYGVPGGKGAKIAGVFNLYAGEILQIAVGDRGQSSYRVGYLPGYYGFVPAMRPNSSAGGGGGSFVVGPGNTPLLVAGGGGGASGSDVIRPLGAGGTGRGGSSYSVPAQRGQPGTAQFTGGAGGAYGYTLGGGGGGSFRQNGQGGISFARGAYGGYGGYSWFYGLSGGRGGSGRDFGPPYLGGGAGGFGGGGGGGGNCGGGGGGGGYAGGAGGEGDSFSWCFSGAGGYGGGSFDAGENPTGKSGYWGGAGFVKIRESAPTPGKVPEPGGYGILTAGAFALASMRWRRK